MCMEIYGTVKSPGHFSTEINFKLSGKSDNKFMIRNIYLNMIEDIIIRVMHTPYKVYEYEF